MQTYCGVLTVAFLLVIILRVPQKKKSSSLEDLQSESLEKVGLFVITISGVLYVKQKEYLYLTFIF